MRICPDCHAAVDDEAFYCDQCGFQLRSRPGTPAGRSVAAPLAPSTAVSADGLDEDRPVPAFPGVVQGACPACGYLNLAGEIFCANCGVQLNSKSDVPAPTPIPTPEAMPAVEAVVPTPAIGVKSCPTCGADNPVSETYCHNCGFWLTAKVQPAAHTAGAELRQTFIQSNVSLPVQPLSESTEKPIVPVPETLSETSPSGEISGRLFSTTTGASSSLPSKTEVILGRRDPDRGIYPDVDLSDQGSVSNSVSRQHARLLAQGKQIFVEDLNSTNSTYLNRQRLQPGQRYLLSEGDELRLGGVVLVYYSK
jgi:hypothetical protein